MNWNANDGFRRFYFQACHSYVLYLTHLIRFFTTGKIVAATPQTVLCRRMLSSRKLQDFANTDCTTPSLGNCANLCTMPTQAWKRVRKDNDFEARKTHAFASWLR